MDIPPWKGLDEPEFIPRIRRTFAELLPDRVERGRAALDRLRAGGLGEMEADRKALRAVAHDLAGTAETLGAKEVGRRAMSITGILRDVRVEGKAPDEALAEVVREWEALEREAERFLGWIRAEDEEAAGGAGGPR